MAYRMPPKLLACLLGSLALLAARGASAQSTGFGGMTGAAAPSLTKADFTFYLQRYSEGNWIQMNTTEQSYFFNRARCECVGDTTEGNGSGYFRIAIQPAANTATTIRQALSYNNTGSGTARLYAGGNTVNCLNPASAVAVSRPSYCVNLLNPSEFDANIEGGIATFAATKVWYSDPIPVAWIFNAAKNPVCSGAACDSTTNCSIGAATVTIYFWAQTGSQQTPDMQDSSFNVNLVGQSTFVPEDVWVEPGHEALTVHWTWPGGLSPAGNASFWGVQIFCVRGADNQVFKTGSFAPSFMTAASTCRDVAPPAASGIDALDPALLCSGLLPSTASSFRIKHLQNDIVYGVGVAAIDKYYNASAITELAWGAPEPTIDFYTQYKSSGGDAQGGYCAVAGSRTSPGLLAIAGLAVLGLIGWRRRGPGGRSLLLLIVTGTLAGSSAQAKTGSIFRDDMAEVRDDDQEVWRGTPRKFAVEARFGLYTPDIDSELSGPEPPPAPHAFIFGTKKRPMWQLEFDYDLYQKFGTVAVGGSIGYFKENAKSCKAENLSASNCTRAADNTSLRLIPLAALLIYRFDLLVEQWRIPIAPYGKLGLNYTFWTITNGNDETPSAGGGRGAGGTWGWQAAVGISLLLDFLDPSAARGFDADAGVNHTYAFFELTHIDASGLGSGGKLHVGDDTWFAGLMFQF